MHQDPFATPVGGPGHELNPAHATLPTVPPERSWRLIRDNAASKFGPELADQFETSPEYQSLEGGPARGVAFLERAPDYLDNVIDKTSRAIDILVESLTEAKDEAAPDSAYFAKLSAFSSGLRTYQMHLVDSASKFRTATGSIPQDSDRIYAAHESAKTAALAAAKRLGDEAMEGGSSLAVVEWMNAVNGFSGPLNEFNGSHLQHRIGWMQVVTEIRGALTFSHQAVFRAFQELLATEGPESSEEGDGTEEKEIAALTAVTLSIMHVESILTESHLSLAAASERTMKSNKEFDAQLLAELPEEMREWMQSMFPGLVSRG